MLFRSVRLSVADAAIARLDELQGEEWTREESVVRTRGLYEFRKRRFSVRAGEAEDDGIEDRSRTYQRMMHSVYEAQRVALVELRGEASAEVLRAIERELDLEESRLDS